jgi:hypothetical protein
MEQAVRLLWEWASWGLPGGDSKAAERVHGGEGGGGGDRGAGGRRCRCLGRA